MNDDQKPNVVQMPVSPEQEKQRCLLLAVGLKTIMTAKMDQFLGWAQANSREGMDATRKEMESTLNDFCRASEKFHALNRGEVFPPQRA